MPQGKQIVLSDKAHGLPFSKGLLAQSFTATGLAPSRAYEVSSAIQEDLREHDELSITVVRLRELGQEYLSRMAGEEYAVRYRKIGKLGRLDKPLIVLVGGTTGVGKSTIATEVAHRLGITRITSTDSIREVMRGIFTKDLMPALHESAFNAWRGLRVPVPHGANPVIVGFREQTAVVSTGVQALIDRAVLEGVSLVVEGVHLVPGYIDTKQVKNARVVQLVIAVADEETHRSHFYIREVQTDGMRPVERYRSNFGNIRLLGHYIEDLAREREIPVIYSHQLDRTVAETLEYIVNAAVDQG
ncbi:MAG: 2-phosphoglycerate kinase [Actinomycetota bacterium]|jgi:2-phosphoglycerate kinase|nr:2-phosphoglycerate kinase [Actinomycetota bacterium]